ncbi:MAG: hypothetical protein P4L35_06220 [Ignavibacteriaceae bacterium]|nr:hypothetical protein [Ignavibacteriaceae bacterium]
MIKIKNNLSGKYFGTLNKDINKKREGFQGIREFMSIWRNGMNKPSDILNDAFK